MPEAFVGLASNCDAQRALAAGAAALRRRFGAVRFSALYRSRAEGLPAADYLNAVAQLRFEAGAAALRRELRALEAACGRTRADPRVCELDLDLLFYGVAVDAGERLPRPAAFSTPYVVVPLAELLPQLAHPLTGELCGTAAQRVRHVVERVAALA